MMREYYWLSLLLLFPLLLCGCAGGAVVAGEEEVLKASGTIRADKVRVASEMGGRILAVKAAEGQEVNDGDLLVELNAIQLQGELAQAEAAAATAEADLAVVRAGPSREEVDAARAALALAEAERDGARSAWELAQEVLENPQELDARLVEARGKVQLAAQGVEGAEAELTAEEIRRDREMEGGSDFRVQAAQEALAAARAEEEMVRVVLGHLEEMRRRPLELTVQANAAQGKYRLAEEGVEVARARLDDLLDRPRPEEIAEAEAAARRASAEADVLRAQIEKFTLTSPIGGIVLERALRPAEIDAPAATILPLADLSTVTLEVYVPENRVGWVQLGQDV
ncbi:MAG: efflux RND transporter periplasmic adaptor subunit, partial [Anaerolineae bacterium]